MSHQVAEKLDVEKILDDGVKKCVKRFLAILKKNQDWRAGLDTVRAFVERLVLPRGDAWARTKTGERSTEP